MVMIFSCGLKQKDKTQEQNRESNKKTNIEFLKNYKPITHIKNVTTGQIEEFHININKEDSIIEDGIKFYNINIKGFGNNIYIGFNKNIIYTFDKSKSYSDKTFILKPNQLRYYSFFCGYDYRVDKTSFDELDVEKKDTIYMFDMSKLKDSKGSDYFYDSGEYPENIFKKVTFSKEEGIIEATIYNERTNETYITISSPR